jgi:hypothetical protein
VNGDLFVTTDTEGTDSVTSLGVDGSLTSELFKHLGGTSESVTRFTNANVENQLLEAERTHGVGGSFFFRLAREKKISITLANGITLLGLDKNRSWMGLNVAIISRI